MDSLTLPILTVVVSVAGTWAVMRSQVADLRAKASSQDGEIREMRDRITRLEERHDGLVDKLSDALVKLESVTEKLEALALKIAGGGK